MIFLPLLRSTLGSDSATTPGESTPLTSEIVHLPLWNFKNFPPHTEVESVLMAHPDIKEVAVIGVADSKWGEVGCAVIASISGNPISLDALHRQCDGNLARFKWPQQVALTDALPRNSTGKVQKFILRQEHA